MRLPLARPSLTERAGDPIATAVLADDALQVRGALPAEAPVLYRLISANLETGHLLPRTLEELTAHARRFLVLADGDRVIGCAELAPLSSSIAEIRSFVVDEPHRGRRLGAHLVEVLKRRAHLDGYQTLCAFTHEPASFVRMGFSIVPHVWLPQKITTDCHKCALFRRCGQYAMWFGLRPRPALTRGGRRTAPHMVAVSVPPL